MRRGWLCTQQQRPGVCAASAPCSVSTLSSGAGNELSSAKRYFTFLYPVPVRGEREISPQQTATRRTHARGALLPDTALHTHTRTHAPVDVEVVACKALRQRDGVPVRLCPLLPHATRGAVHGLQLGLTRVLIHWRQMGVQHVQPALRIHGCAG